MLHNPNSRSYKSEYPNRKRKCTQWGLLNTASIVWIFQDLCVACHFADVNYANIQASGFKKQKLANSDRILILLQCNLIYMVKLNHVLQLWLFWTLTHWHTLHWQCGNDAAYSSQTQLLVDKVHHVQGDLIFQPWRHTNICEAKRERLVSHFSSTS